MLVRPMVRERVPYRPYGEEFFVCVHARISKTFVRTCFAVSFLFYSGRILEFEHGKDTLVSLKLLSPRVSPNKVSFRSRLRWLVTHDVSSHALIQLWLRKACSHVDLIADDGKFSTLIIA